MLPRLQLILRGSCRHEKKCTHDDEFMVDHINDDEEKKENTQFFFCFNLKKKTQRKRTNSLVFLSLNVAHSGLVFLLPSVRPFRLGMQTNKHTQNPKPIAIRP